MRGSANDELIAETSCFVLNSLLYGKPLQLFGKTSGVFCFMGFKYIFIYSVLLILMHFEVMNGLMDSVKN